MIVEMLGQLGELLNDPNEERYYVFHKLVRLNIAQQQLVSEAPLPELANLLVYNYLLTANDTYEQNLPLDFFRELSAQAIVSINRNRVWRLLPPDTAPVFPFNGGRHQPVVKISDGKILSFGRPFDEDVYFNYYRWPRWMKVTNVPEAFIEDAGKIVPMDPWVGANIGPELMPTSYQAMVQRAYQAFLVSDSEVKEVQARQA